MAIHLQRPRLLPPRSPQERFQESGLRRSRALQYILHVDAGGSADGIALDFVNEGAAGATFHVYDRRHLDRLPRRYAVEAGKRLSDRWLTDGEGSFDLLVLGPNGFMRSFVGTDPASLPAVVARYDKKQKALALTVAADGSSALDLTAGQDRYGVNRDRTLSARGGAPARLRWDAGASHNWYDFAITTERHVFGLAGRLENGSDGVSDPLFST